MRIGFIGLGIMGRGMVKNLVSKGHEVTLWNRTAATAKSLFPGLVCASSPSELASRVDMVISCVADPAAVARVVFAEDGVQASARAGFAYVECSTIGPEQARSIADGLGQRGAEVLVAPVTGSKLGAENGTLLFMTGGDAAVHTRLEPLLLAMGTKAIHCGTVEQACVVKLANNSLISFMLEGLCEGALVTQRAGIPLAAWLNVIQNSIFGCGYYAFKGKALAERDFSTHFSLDLLVKDQNMMLDYAVRARAPMPGLAAIREVYRAGQARGHGAEDMASVIKVLESLAGLSKA